MIIFLSVSWLPHRKGEGGLAGLSWGEDAGLSILCHQHEPLSPTTEVSAQRKVSEVSLLPSAGCWDEMKGLFLAPRDGTEDK